MLVLVVVPGPEDVYLCVKLARRVRLYFDFFAGDILDELENAVLDRGIVAGLGDILLHVRHEGFDGRGCGGVEEEAAFLAPGGALVNIDADQNADLFQVGEVRSEGKVARRAEVADQNIEETDVGIVGENACEFIDQRVFASVGKKPSAHGLSAPSRNGHARRNCAYHNLVIRFGQGRKVP